MSAGGVYLLLDVALSALSAKLERDVILAKIRERQAQGASLEQISAEIKAMRDEAIAKAQADLNAS